MTNDVAYTPGSRIKLLRFGRHHSSTHWATIVSVTPFKVSVVIDNGTQMSLRTRDGYECGYNGDRWGWRLADKY